MAYRSSFGFGYGLTPWVQRLIVANALVFLVQYAQPGVTDAMAFVPGRILFRPWTLVTYMFAHGGFMHILFNMLGLFFFGPALEARWGSREFIKFYFICGIGGAILSFLFVNSAIIGASAAVYGVMLAFAMNWPDTPIYIWAIFPVPAKILVAIMAAFSLFSAFSGPYDGVAHFAHLGGFVAAWIYIRWDRRSRRPASPGKLRTLMARRRLTVVPGASGRDERTPPTRGPAPGTPDDRELLDQLDRVLDKINESGMASLTPAERKLLDDVSRRYRQN
ncbi:MAG: rhomboid family intramembrane serine protease [Gemmatimonadetes bacterium]|nr:rhomboid family intramembrane serine protease [Gemmatimonadota bacterium]